MSSAAKSLFMFGIYAVAAGTGLLLIPGLVLAMLGFPPVQDGLGTRSRQSGNDRRCVPHRQRTAQPPSFHSCFCLGPRRVCSASGEPRRRLRHANGAPLVCRDRSGRRSLDRDCASRSRRSASCAASSDVERSLAIGDFSPANQVVSGINLSSLTAFQRAK